ncbi:pseudouridylate synthase TRUB2, mitochondrial-like [Haliotis cracherodii]|uniref:pseudouridylate synthase TRUB2, mitochondrial-like n=1 Tax=Haliotis cracherodii TaxID=6455 RepID=UPI0039E80847
MMKFDWGPSLFRRLSGVFCIYKPTGPPVHKVLEIIRGNLNRDINALPCYKYERRIQRVKANTEEKLPSLSSLPVDADNLAQHRLTLGPRYIPEDFILEPLHGLSRHAAGVLVIGMGRGCEYLEHIALARYLRVYHVRGRFGWATDNYSPKGKILERTTFHNITKPKLDKVCAAAQANHTKYMFDYAGVRSDSQEAYTLAASGLVRPENGKTPPILYGVKCIEFNPPDFTLEIHAINEKCTYLMNFIGDVGLSLKSTAVCTHIRRVRYGHFELQHALLRKQWTAEHILDNIQSCSSLLSVDKLATSDSVRHLDQDGRQYRQLGYGREGLTRDSLKGGNRKLLSS